VLGLWEFYRMARVSSWLVAILGACSAAVLVPGGVGDMPGEMKSALEFAFVVLLALAVASYAVTRAVRPSPASPRLRGYWVYAAGLVYPSLLCAHLVSLRDLQAARTISGLPAGAGWLFLVVGATWVMDIAAYVVGRAIGRHKLCPTISPGKTIEGAIGGLVGAVAVAWAMGMWLGLSAMQAVLLGVLLGLGGQAGDLFESLLKRRAGVKDSGTLLPGHGGVLDRFDSLLFNAPIAYYVIRAFVG